MKRNLTITILLLQQIGALFSQESKIDSLQKKLEQASSEDSARIFIELVNESYNQCHFNKFLSYAQKALYIGQKNNLKFYEAKAYMKIGKV